MASPAASAVRFISKPGKVAVGALQIQLHVKPGANKNREGVVAVREHAIELCVAAQAREGEANKAVLQVLSDVLGVPKTQLQLVRGLKSRDKTVLLDGIAHDGELQASRILGLLQQAIE
ncbi:hypothetical protein HJFPF1_12861 [Paramyrothecium foliicola]|nr:hypothetical protein HJFPF1_12861 [Paramyrothecium foliicola]